MYIRTTRKTDFEVFTPSHSDLAEAEALGVEPSFPDAEECVTLDRMGFPLAIGGNQGDRVWFVTSDQVWRLDRKEKLEFIDAIKGHRDMLLENYCPLWNYVYIGNKSHVRFLKAIGAVFHNEFADQERKFQLFTIGG